MLKVLSTNLEDGLFLLESISFNDWNIYFYKEFSNLFFNPDNNLNQDIKNELSPYINFLKSDYKTQLLMRSTPFLVGFYINKKEIRFYTPKLSAEMLLLKQSENFGQKSLVFLELKKHIEMALNLPLGHLPTVIESLTELSLLPNLLLGPDLKKVEERTNQLTNELLIKLNQYRPSLFEKMTDFGLGLTAEYALLRVHLLKFLAILPSLDHDQKGLEVKRILLESLDHFLMDNQKSKQLQKTGQERPFPHEFTFWIKGFYFLAKILPAYLLAWLVRISVKMMAKRFIAGESIEKADKSLLSLRHTGRDVTLDQLGELVVSKREADHYKNQVLKLIKGFSLHVKKGEENKAGINRAHVSIKVSALCPASNFLPHAPDHSYSLVGPKLKEILLAAQAENVFINIDAEHYHYRDIVFKIFKRVLLETPELKDYKACGIVVQAYLRDAYQHLQEIVELAKTRRLVMPVRLVKGAYWDAETVEADTSSLNAPQFLNKEETDIHYRQLIIKIYQADPHLSLALASHNFSDHAYARAVKEVLFPNIHEIEHQCLHMTYEALSTALAKMNWPTRNYLPVGDLLVGMAYLVRRIMENSSQVGVLTIMRSHQSVSVMRSLLAIHQAKKDDGSLVLDPSLTKMDDEFFNVPGVRLYLESERIWVEQALELFGKNKLGIEYQSEFMTNGELKTIIASSNPEIIVGKIRFANLEDAEKAITMIDESYHLSSWPISSGFFRSLILVKAAMKMLALRNDLAALIVYEAGKTITEALGDVDEAIDFLNFYARNEMALQKNYFELGSRGPVLVISPWNFPLAIPCGMMAAGLVAGNTVILKSAEQTPLIAHRLVEIMHQAGVPTNVLIHLPGEGETIGDFLVKDPRISTIVFTGSLAVGTSIAAIARKKIFFNKRSNQSYPLKVITEMGGKNAVIVTQNAELDEAVAGILYSSFLHAGQKCSAASRVIVHNAIKEKLIERLKEATNDLLVGESFNFNTTINPLISKEDSERIKESAKEAGSEARQFFGRVILDRSLEKFPGFCVGPVLIELPYSRAFDPSSFSQKELFGPIVHVIGFETLDQAIKLYNSTKYALTGGIFSQSENDIEYLVSKMESGNIYVNRTVTGARVGIEPFGGFKLSGSGPKAGGLNYLLSFHQMNEKEIESSKSEIFSIPTEEGVDQNFDLVSASLLSTKERLEGMERFLDYFISHLEIYYQEASLNDKELLRDYKKWLGKNFIDLIELKHKNRNIPGQLSFNDHHLSIAHGVLVATTTTPAMKTLIQVFAAISCGVGLLVLARNKKAHTWWSKLLNLFNQEYFLLEKNEVRLVSSKDLKKTLNKAHLGVIIYDGPIDEYSPHIGNFLDDGKNELRMKKILTTKDYLKANDFYNQTLNFIEVRSLAINTMRHGAPLELGF